MRKIKTYEQYHNSNLYDSINSIMESDMSYDEIDNLLEEGFFSFLKGLFSNPKKKKELDRLVAKLIETRIAIAKIDIEENNIEEFKDELEDDDSFSRSSHSSDDNDPTQIKKANLENLEEEILNQMDRIGEENETLQKYVDKVKLEARMEATDKIIKLADAEIKKILTKLKQKDAKRSKQLDKEIKDSF